MQMQLSPETTLQPLYRADGSTSYSYDGFRVLAAVNGPVEIQRRDELPEEAAIDVAIRPASGLGSVRERHLESIIHKTLRHVILVAAHPRKLIQITLHIVGTPEVDKSMTGAFAQAISNIAALPALLNATLLALLTTSIPLAMTFTTSVAAVDPQGEISFDASPRLLRKANSFHVVAVSSNGRILIAESEGEFDLELWEAVVTRVFNHDHGDIASVRNHKDPRTTSTEASSFDGFVRRAVTRKVALEQRWQEDLYQGK